MNKKRIFQGCIVVSILIATVLYAWKFDKFSEEQLIELSFVGYPY